MTKRLFSLKTRLALTYGTLLLLLIGALLIITHSLLGSHFEDYIAAQHEQVAKNVVATIQEQLEETPLEEIHFTELGYSLLHQGMVLSVWDVQGKQVYCIHCTDTKACSDMLNNIQCTTALRDSSYVGTYTETEYPLEVDGVPIGSVRLGYSGPYYYTTADVDFIGHIDTVFIYAGLACVLLAAAASFMMARSIVRPIREIGEQTRLIGEGNYETALPEHPYAKELHELAQRVNGLAKTLEEQQKAKQRMIKDYAHELRTPLSVLQANLEAFQDGVWEPTPERLGSCYEEIERLTRMLSHMEDLAQLYDPKRELNFEEIDLRLLCQGCLNRFEPVCNEKKIVLSSQIEDVHVWGDGDKLRQVVLNLLSNGVQYTPEGGSLHLSLHREENYAVLKVHDTGIGISAEDIPYVFDYLYRADPSRSRHTGGSGIGLSIVKKIVQEHGGDVWVDSHLNQGSEFTVKLPIKNQ